MRKSAGEVESRCEGSGFLKRAHPQQLFRVFEKYASVEKNGEKFMTFEDFVIKYLGFLESGNYNARSVHLVAAIVDTDKDGLVSYSEFQSFERTLCFPDALYKTAFRLFDTSGNGTVSFHEFAEVIIQTELDVPFNMDSSSVLLYFGKDKNRSISYSEFTQFLRDFHEERVVECFRRADADETGFISVSDFQNIMINTKSNLLTRQVQSRFIEIAQGSRMERRVSFPYFNAFTSLLSNVELAKSIYLNVTNGHRTQEVTRDEFMHSAQLMSLMTPLEVDILYQLCDVHHQTGGIVYSDLDTIVQEQMLNQGTSRLIEICAVSSPEDRGVFIQILESVYRFTLGSIAGAIGATAVYPIDLVKTRMQNQRTGTSVDELMYRNSFDCFKKVVRHEGVFGLYRGLVPQLFGVAPEKALKLTVHDVVRDKFHDANGDVPLHGEILAGASAGAGQVVLTNPLEIVKIRLQVAGEIAGGAKVRAWSVVRELGLSGLYRGMRACLMRDIPFNAIYFTTYAHAKAALADDGGYNAPFSLLIAGAVSCLLPSPLLTPADVIKTRLQVAARPGQTAYTGIFDAAKKIHAEEGLGAFWKGAVARTVRSSPQFGVTLLAYELLQRVLYVDFGGTRPGGSEVKSGDTRTNPDHIGGYSVAIPIFAGIESKFGICLPKFRVDKP